MADPVELEARRLLRAQSEVLAQYAAAVENDLAKAGNGHSEHMRGQLHARAQTARELAGVMFRAATHEPDVPAGGV